MLPDDGPESPPHPFVLPPGFLDSMPLHLRDPYYPQHQQPAPEPESEPEEEPESEPEEEPEQVVPELEHDDATSSGTDSAPDDGLQPYDWDEEEQDSDDTDGLDDAVVIDPPYPTRSRTEVTPLPSYIAPQEPGGARWRYTPRMSVPPVGSARILRPSAMEHPDYPDPYAAGPSYVRRDMGESSSGTQHPAFLRQPYYSQGPGETMGEIRHRIAQLEARAASVDETYGPLISASFMHGIHIRVLEQDRDRLEDMRLATQEEERLQAQGDRKRKGPAE